jgi:type II secretion system protein H
MFKQVRVRSDERGFTLIEVLTAMAIMGITLGIVAGGSMSWTRAREQSGTAQQLVSFMRQAQQRALTEATSYCVKFETSRTYTMRKGTCASAIVRGPAETDAAGVTLVASFAQTDGTDAAQVIFTPRGSASPGTATVERAGRDPIVVHVEGLTARVSTA